MAFLIFEYVDDECRSIYDDAPPARATVGSAGFDLRAMEDAVIQAGQSIKVPTGIKIQQSSAMCGFILPRSGLATSKGLIIPNSPGLIDSDYRGEIIVCLHNLVKRICVMPHAALECAKPNPMDSRLWYGDKVEITAGDRIAQIVFQPVLDIKWKEGQLNKTARGENGHGSTDAVGKV